MGRRAPARGQLLSHTALLQFGDPPEIVQRRLDAIVVPSARPAAQLAAAADLAWELAAPLVVLASRKARRDEILAALAHPERTGDLIVIDAPETPVGPVPYLETTDMFAGTAFEYRTDVSRKRNLALLLARTVGWRHVLFLDDDIAVPDPADLRRAVGALDHYDAAGLYIDGFPDNSVVCHARRSVGDHQGTFVGGGALAVPVHRDDAAFFPDVYNEDWLFLVGPRSLRPVSLIGSAVQGPYDPFADPDRARQEEFGDTLAEGLFALLSRHGTVPDALNDGYWVGFLGQRRALIRDLLRRTDTLPPGEHRDRIVEALRAARGRSFLIEPRQCVRFLLAWQRDRVLWQEVSRSLPTDLNLAEALDHFGLRGAASVRPAESRPSVLDAVRPSVTR
ncbi:hypothetical protein [Dactylosporangium sp. NPDC051541]|uniref:hypothetical protein n=1 Tax=Dactylosporangium sp. NPDC051541 TaxID=3363977 RepID=UPI00378EAC77